MKLPNIPALFRRFKMDQSKQDSDNLSNTDDSLSPGGDDASSPSQRNWEAEARTMGWRPKDVYRGDPGKFIEAKEFVENGEKNLPIIRAALKRTQDEVDRLKLQGAEHARVIESARAREVADLQAKLTEAKQSRKEAIAGGDGEAFEIAEGEVKRLEDEVAKAKTPSKQQQPGQPTAEEQAAMQTWLDAHPRYNDDPVFAAVCDKLSISPQFKDKAGRGLMGAFWDEVYTAAEKQMEGYSRGTDRDRPGSQRGGRGSDSTNTRRGSERRSYENLTGEMKRTCDRMSKDYGYTGERLKKFQADYVSQCTDDAFSN
jgi:hypothetical protein